MKVTIIKKTGIFCFFLFLFLFQNGLQQKIALFQYVDEVFGLLAVPLFFLRLLQKEISIQSIKNNRKLIILFGIFWISGWCGTFYYQYQPLEVAVKDSYVNIKFLLAVITAYLIFVDVQQQEFKQMEKKIWPVLNAITLFLFLLCVIDLCFGIYSTETRGGLRAVKLFYSTYTFLVGNCVLLSSVYLWLYEEKRKKVIPPLIMLAFIMVSTRRVKAMGAVACICLIYLFVFCRKQKLNRKTKIMVGLVVGAAATAGVYQTISYYYLMGIESARAVLTIASPFVAIDHFPFGSGWGTYGSAFSADPYSPVYGMYRMAGVWGISPEYSEFISDTFWPMELAQCGVVGFAALLALIVVLIGKILRLRSDKSIFASALLPVLYLFISSSSESAFVNPISIPLAFWIGFLFAACRNIEEKDQPRRQK